MLIRAAQLDELGLLADIERDADRVLLDALGVTEFPVVPEKDAAGGFTLVAIIAGSIVGFIQVWEAEGVAHIEQLSVRIGSARQGIGGALLDAALQQCAASGHHEVTLTTFADVPWNAPWYARRGFAEICADTPFLRNIELAEEASGLSALGRRISMRIDLSRA